MGHLPARLLLWCGGGEVLAVQWAAAVCLARSPSHPRLADCRLVQ